jgi:hypothetical protein
MAQAKEIGADKIVALDDVNAVDLLKGLDAVADTVGAITFDFLLSSSAQHFTSSSSVLFPCIARDALT